MRQPVRRIETPQFFWMRVAMGLFIQEEKDREEWVVAPLQPLQVPALLLEHADPLQLRHPA